MVGGQLTVAGIIQDQGGKIVHSAPQVPVVDIHVMSEDVVPQPCFQVALHFGQVEIGTAAFRQLRAGVMEEEEVLKQIAKAVESGDQVVRGSGGQ